MKTVRLFLSLVIILFSATSLCSCLSDDDDEGRKVLSSKDYVITVASCKLEGVVASCGNFTKTEVLAIRKDGSTNWEAWGGIQGFNYEPGYEYRLKVNETTYLDYSMGEPAWTEHKLLEVLSIDKKETEGLPEDLIPEWYIYYVEHPL